MKNINQKICILWINIQQKNQEYVEKLCKNPVLLNYKKLCEENPKEAWNKYMEAFNNFNSGVF